MIRKHPQQEPGEQDTEVMGGPEPDEPGTGVMGSSEPREPETDVMRPGGEA